MKYTVIVQLALLIFLFSCDEEVNRPAFQTLEVTELTDQGVSYNGKVSLLGNSPIDNYGFVWATHTNPGINDSVYNVAQMPETGKFSARISDGLVSGSKYFVRAFLKSSQQVYYGNTVSFTSLGSATPVISDFNPKSGSSDETVTITGDHFGERSSNIIVSIGTTTCKVISATHDKLVIQIPSYFTTGNYPIYVTVAEKTGKSATDFSLEGPIIQTLSPTAGAAGTVVTLTGSGFSSSATENEVVFGDKRAVVSSAALTQLTVTVPEDPGTGAKQVSVRIKGLTGIASAPFILTGPTITSFSPASGIQGTEVVITGSGFSSNPEENMVSIGNYYGTAQVISASPQQLTVRVPLVNAAGEFAVLVTVKSSVAVASGLFTIEGPEITSITPGSQYGGRTVILGGKNFEVNGYATTVYFLNLQASILSQSPTSLTIQVPYELTQPTQIAVQAGGIVYKTPSDFSPLSPWNKETNFPGGKRYGASSFTVGAYSYICMGIGQTGDRKDVWQYNPSNNSWTKKADYPGPSRAFSFSFVVNGKAYVGGGGHYGNSLYDLINKHYDLWEYDPAADSWTQKQSFSPNGLSNIEYVAATGIESNGYFIANNFLYRYDPSANQWSVSSSFPWSYSQGGVAVTIGNKGYFGLGFGNTTFWEFNPGTGTWTQLASGPSNLGYATLSFVLNNKIYVGNYNSFYEFDPSSNLWKQLPDVPVFLNYPAAFSINNTGYFATGLDGVANDLFYSFNPDY